MNTCRHLAVALLGSLAALALLTTLPATAADAPAGKLTLSGGWARATPPGVSVGAAYFVIDNPGSRSDRLLALASARARSAELHRTVHDGGIVEMRRVDPLHVDARSRTVLEPGGLHVMLMGLTRPLVAGETFTLELKFERAGTLTVTVQVAAPRG